MINNILCIGAVDNHYGDGLSQDARTISFLKSRAHFAVSAVSIKPSQDNETYYYNIPKNVLVEQVETSLSRQNIHAVKIGYLGTSETIEALADLLVSYKKHSHLPMIIDPSILDARKKQLIDKKALDSLKRDLILHADIITPSVNEGAFLTGLESARSQEDMHHMADMLLTLGPKAVFLRGGKFEEGRDTDILATDSTHLAFSSVSLSPRTGGIETLGSIVSSAIAVGIAQNRPFSKTIEDALDYVSKHFLETV